MPRIAGLLFFGLLLGVAQPAAAQPYPSQPIRLIAPFPPGGSVDIMARLISEPLAQQLGGKIVIDNRSGASGNIGMEAAARAKPDGYTVVLNTIPLATNQALFDKLSWDPIKDFAPIGMVATAPHVLVIPPKVKAGKVDELVKLARASPGKLTYASAGVGTTFHLCGEMFKDSTGTFILHVPYRGGGPALLDTLGGQVDMSFPTLSAALAAREGGQPARARRDQHHALAAPARRPHAAGSRRQGLPVHPVACPPRACEYAPGRGDAPQHGSEKRTGVQRRARQVRAAGFRRLHHHAGRRRQVHRVRGEALRDAHQKPKDHCGIRKDAENPA